MTSFVAFLGSHEVTMSLSHRFTVALNHKVTESHNHIITIHTFIGTQSRFHTIIDTYSQGHTIIAASMHADVVEKRPVQVFQEHICYSCIHTHTQSPWSSLLLHPCGYNQSTGCALVIGLHYVVICLKAIHLLVQTPG